MAADTSTTDYPKTTKVEIVAHATGIVAIGYLAVAVANFIANVERLINENDGGITLHCDAVNIERRVTHVNDIEPF